MQFPESWLREFCDPPLSSAELADALTMGGLEVESAQPAAPPFSRVVVAEVLAVEPHPNADRLRVCTVDAGGTAPLSIVCGAPNVEAGLKVPCALVGAELPPAEAGATPPTIRRGSIRGVESAGMLCSARELGLSDDHGGLLVLDGSLPVGADLRQALALDDTILTLKLTPNLGHALGIEGVARELSAITGTPLKRPSFAAVPVEDASVLPVRIEASDLCGRFSGRVVRGVDTRAKTPLWMTERLARCGQRSVAPLVDISNYVMFELGRPSHIFDLDTIDGGLVVRWAKAGEALELLNGNTVTLAPDVGVIADASGPESLAGIMGGQRTAVGDATANIYIEAAFWWPESIVGRARRYKFSTDAGHRFERGVDAETTVAHIERITRLVVDICGTTGTTVGPIDDHVARLPERKPVAMRVERASRVIGMSVTQADCERVMTRLGFAWTSRPGVVEVTPPSWRFDLTLEEDLIEEVIRLIGYDALPASPPVGRIAAHVPSETRRADAGLRHAMAALGWQETISFSFVASSLERDLLGNAEPVRVVNPIADGLDAMRSSLLPSLLEVLKTNLARRAPRVFAFELGRVFVRDAAAREGPSSVAGVRQPLRLGGVAWGPASPPQWGERPREVDFFDVKGDLESLLGASARFAPAEHPALHPGRTARVVVGGEAAGFVGELHPRWRQRHEIAGAPILFELDVEPLRRLALPAFATLPRQQPSWRDIAVVAPRTAGHDELIATARAAGEGVVRSATLFDLYEPKTQTPGIGDGERSLAVRLELRDDAETLTDARIESVVAAVVDALGRRLGARLRA